MRRLKKASKSKYTIYAHVGRNRGIAAKVSRASLYGSIATWPMGTHKGRAIGYVLDTDLQYIEWAVSTIELYPPTRAALLSEVAQRIARLQAIADKLREPGAEAAPAASLAAVAVPTTLDPLFPDEVG